MKRELREELRNAQMRAQQGKFEAFVNEYLTTKNVLWGVGIASIAGVATYSTVRVLKNEKLMSKIKEEFNFDHIKKNISSKFKEVMEQKEEGNPGNKSLQSPGRRPVKGSKKPARSQASRSKR